MTAVSSNVVTEASAEWPVLEGALGPSGRSRVRHLADALWWSAARLHSAVSLAIPVTTFVGRDADIDTLPRVLRDRRLVTLTGAGGCGKTRLALELARLVEDEFEAVVWIDLASLTDPSLVSTTVA